MVRLGYNALWIAPIIMAFRESISYTEAFTAFTLVVALRFGANLVANNMLNLNQFNNFPFRA